MEPKVVSRASGPSPVYVRRHMATHPARDTRALGSKAKLNISHTRLGCELIEKSAFQWLASQCDLDDEALGPREGWSSFTSRKPDSPSSVVLTRAARFGASGDLDSTVPSRLTG